MTEPQPTYNGRQAADLAPQAVKLARRVQALAAGTGQRHKFELLVTADGRWLLIVDGGSKVEELGSS